MLLAVAIELSVLVTGTDLLTDNSSLAKSNNSNLDSEFYIL